MTLQEYTDKWGRSEDDNPALSCFFTHSPAQLQASLITSISPADLRELDIWYDITLGRAAEDHPPLPCFFTYSSAQWEAARADAITPEEIRDLHVRYNITASEEWQDALRAALDAHRVEPRADLQEGTEDATAWRSCQGCRWCRPY